MTNTYNWSVSSIYTLQQPNPNYVVNVFWSISGSDGKNTVTSHGNTKLPVQESNKNFIPYDQLTEAQVVTWIKQEVGQEEVALLQSNLDDRLNSINNQTSVPEATPLPWDTM